MINALLQIDPNMGGAINPAPVRTFFYSITNLGDGIGQ
jgi:hypothetical protein